MFMVSKASAEVTTPVAAKGLVADGTPQELVTEGKNEDGAFFYSVHQAGGPE